MFAYFFVSTTLRIAKLFESSQRSKLEFNLFWSTVVFNIFLSLITLIVGSLLVAADDFHYEPANHALETLRQIFTVIKNWVPAFL
jgi:hypothetical protein